MPSALKIRSTSSPASGFLEREQPGQGLDDGDGGAEAGEDLGEFRADRPAAQHDQRLGYPFGLNYLPVRPERGAGQPVQRGDRGIGADVDHDALAGLEDPGAPGAGDRHLAGSGDLPAAADQVAALTGEPVGRHLVVPVVGGLVPDPPGDRRPVGGDLGRPGQAGHPPGLGDQIGGADHHLGWHASEIGAFPADQAGFDPGHVQARFGQRPGRVFAAGPQADHHHIRMLWFAHAGLLPCVASHHAAPARSGLPFRGNSPMGAKGREAGIPGRAFL